MHKPLPDSLRVEAQRLHVTGLSTHAIAHQLKVGATTVQRWLRPQLLAAVRADLLEALPLAREAVALAKTASNAAVGSDLQTRGDALHVEAVSLRALVHIQFALAGLDQL